MQQLKQIAEDVYACLQEDKGLGYSNSGLVNRGAGLVIDTCWDLAHTRTLIAEYAKVWKQQPSRLVNTHRNGDHCWGNQLFADCEIIAHRLCAAGFGKEKPEALQACRNAVNSKDPAEATLARALSEWNFAGIVVTRPTTVFDDRMELDLDGIRVNLIYLGPAHTAGDTIVHLPDQRIVFTGDILFRRCTPIGWDGTHQQWVKALDYIVDLEPDIIMPGHGPLCGVEGPKEMKAYLEYVRAESRRCYDAGTGAFEAAKRIDPGPYAGWTEPERILFNIERFYREFRGEPFDAPVDTIGVLHRMFRLRS